MGMWREAVMRVLGNAVVDFARRVQRIDMDGGVRQIA
jgi:hypothetical protein